MTLKELSQLYYLNREIEMDKERLEALRARASAPGSPNYDGMPKSPSYENRLERYIADIPDSNLRMIFTLRFINGLSWVQLAFSIGGDCTADGARMACNRYIKKTNEQNN